MAVYEMTKKQIAEVTKLRNWAKCLAAACQDDLDNKNCPPDLGDGCGVETEATLFLENAKKHFTMGDTYSKVITCADEFCPFCGLEDEEYISDPDDCCAGEIITPWAAI